MKNLSLIFILLFWLHNSLNAQTLNGTVINYNGKPIPDADIVNINKGNHTHTDEDGKFSLQPIAIGDTLKLSNKNYSAKTFIVQDLKKEVKITLNDKSIDLKEVVIGKKLDALNVILDVNLETQPVNSSQEILRQVPGLFIAQHAGGGKAEQIFLRGFDIDHGTDLAITVDGLPVNMVSHAHGQGYSDLHFLIPETVETIDFGKGAYYANKGNFNTAGYVGFNTKKKLENSAIKLEVGGFNTFRTLGLFNLLESKKHNSYLAAEYLSSDGPFDSPQNFNRLNLFGKYVGKINPDSELGVTVSHFTSEWDASGQIPKRAVADGTISRFGAIDDTEGGNTNRTNILVDYNQRIDEKSSIKNKVFYSNYNFELYSNFTFFFNDPINGDQIRQKENRNIFGLNSEYNRLFSMNSFTGEWQAGISLRNDRVEDNELSHTANRSETLEQIQFGNVNETNLGAYINVDFNLGKWTINPGIRVDYFDFQYNDDLQTQYETQSETQSIISPKLNVLYNYSNNLQLYLKTGKGFHSNDTRVVVAQNGNDILPASYGGDIGFLWKPIPRLIVNTAYWYLFLEQEFVYVGDAGIVEPSGKTERQGFDLSTRFQVLDWLYWNLDTTYTFARSTEEASDNDYIPLAPDFTLTSGVSVIHPSGIYGGLNMRHLGDRPANEDNSIVAEGYTVFDTNFGYKWNRWDFGVQIQNLFDVEWDETQFATESRLQNELTPVEEIHFTPGTPFYLRATVQYSF